MSDIDLEQGHRYGLEVPFEERLYPDPLDLDGDSIADGQEINSYDLTRMELKKKVNL